MKFFAAALVMFLSAPALANVNKGDRTMGKVVKMLQKMMEKSKKDGEKDRDLYAKFKCYCDDNEAEKKESINEYTKEIQMIENSIAKIQAASGELSEECAKLKQEIGDNEQARKDAEEIRKKEEEDFKSEEEDMNGGLDAMDDAIKTLTAIGADSSDKKSALIASNIADQEAFMGKKKLVQLKATVKKALGAVSILLNPKEKRTVDAFLQAPFTGTYTSSSGEIVGILKTMRDTFKENLKEMRSAEKAAAEAHEKFMKIKKGEHETYTELYEEKQSKLGENEDELAGEQEKLKEAQESLESDEEFLAKLLVMCKEKAKMFEQRNILRANEEAAISKAISILNSDAAFEAFGNVKATKSGATGLFFIQVQQHNQHASTRKNVIKLLGGLARKMKSFKLARVLSLLEAENPFDTVLKEIKKMIAIIDEEEKADDAQKKWCEGEREEYNENKEKTKDDILDLQGKIEELDDSINNEETGFKAMIKADEESLKENHKNQVDQTSERQEANRAYQTNVKNVVTAEELLGKAIKVLKRFYDQFDEFLLQKEDPAENAPEIFEDKEGGVQKDAGGEVIKMLEFIKEETGKELEEAHSDEEKAQHEFEDAMEDLKKDQTKLEENIADLKVDLAEAEKSLGETKVELVKTEGELKGIKKYLLKIKPGCDYIEENFDARVDARKAEKKALEEATDLIKDTPAYKKAEAKAKEFL